MIHQFRYHHLESSLELTFYLSITILELIVKFDVLHDLSANVLPYQLLKQTLQLLNLFCYEGVLLTRHQIILLAYQFAGLINFDLPNSTILNDLSDQMVLEY